MYYHKIKFYLHLLINAEVTGKKLEQSDRSFGCYPLSGSLSTSPMTFRSYLAHFFTDLCKPEFYSYLINYAQVLEKKFGRSIRWIVPYPISALAYPPTCFSRCKDTYHTVNTPGGVADAAVARVCLPHTFLPPWSINEPQHASEEYVSVV